MVAAYTATATPSSHGYGIDHIERVVDGSADSSLLGRTAGGLFASKQGGGL